MSTREKPEALGEIMSAAIGWLVLEVLLTLFALFIIQVRFSRICSKFLMELISNGNYQNSLDLILFFMPKYSIEILSILSMN